jgi:processive 1,2-diacylglycerol beta-glucosyltransferase
MDAVTALTIAGMPTGARGSSSDAAQRVGPLRILVLTADVGEGHLAAGRALRESLRGDETVEIELEDGLGYLGPVARAIIRDGYRAQLRTAPGSYNLMYAAWRHLPPLRFVAGRLVYRAGHRRLRALARRRAPDIVVSTHPALTVALGRMRRRGELDAVLCATITDLVDDPTWCHRGADLHLVMHPAAVPWVERVAGRGSAVAVRPLVSPRFQGFRDRTAARVALGLPADGTIVVVSGGGWGVGSLADGVEAALHAGAASVVVVAGHNADAQADLQSRFVGERRVSVLGFTDRMPELLAAATVLVHGTGGVTSLEAVCCGCPMIAFGTHLAHVQEHNAAMARLGLCTLAADRRQLQGALAGHVAGDGQSAHVPALGRAALATADAGRVIARATHRVRPIPRWWRATRRVVSLALCTGPILWTVATDDAFSLAARPLHLTPPARLHTHTRAVALVLRAPGGDVALIARRLSADGIHASFAVSRPPSGAVVAQVRAAGDGIVAMLPRPGAVGWLSTLDELGDLRARIGTRMFITSRGGLSLGQYLLARGAGYRPLDPLRRADQARLRPGEVWLLAMSGSSATSSVRGFVARAVRAELVVEPLARLVATSSSRRAVTASDRPSNTPAAPSTSATPSAVSGTPARPWASAPSVTSGPSRMGTSTCITNTEGATRVAGERCSAVISATRPRPDAAPVAAVQARIATTSPWWTASATSWVDSPLHPKHRPASTGAETRTFGRRRTAAHSAPITAPRPTRTMLMSLPARAWSGGAGATSARTSTPTTIAPTAATSARVTDSPSARAPTASSATSPSASAGWTTDSGASSSAAVWIGQPTSPSTVPSSHSGRRTSRATSPARHACSVGVLRASSDCSATPAL